MQLCRTTSLGWGGRTAIGWMFRSSLVLICAVVLPTVVVWKGSVMAGFLVSDGRLVGRHVLLSGGRLVKTKILMNSTSTRCCMKQQAYWMTCSMQKQITTPNLDPCTLNIDHFNPLLAEFIALATCTVKERYHPSLATKEEMTSSYITLGVVRFVVRV